MAVGFPAKTTYADGDVFSASDINDTNGTLNLATGAQWAAGKNKIINGNFGIWQRGTSFSGGDYCADRFINVIGSTSGFSATRQTFTPGTAPVSGYEGQYYLDIAGTLSNTSTGYIQTEQRIEDVRTLAGQTVTLSFWAKGSASGTINTLFTQNFGSGGSAEVLTATSSQNITTSWQRFTVTLSLSSIAGKTIGTGSFLKLIIVKNMGTAYPTYGSSNYTGTLSLWGVQVEASSTATAFQTATGTIQGELAACYRYFESYKSAQNDSGLLVGTLYANNVFIGSFPYSEKRIEPSITLVNAANFDVVYGGTVKDSTGLTITFSNPNKKWSQIAISSTGTPFTQGNGAVLRTDSNFEIQINAEL